MGGSSPAMLPLCEMGGSGSWTGRRYLFHQALLTRPDSDTTQELIKVNALQVAPAELEAALLEFDPIADAATVGITLDDQEWPRAYVALKDEYKGVTTVDDIHEHMKAKVAKHKRLVGGIVFVDEVPKLQSGKIMRKVVKEWAKRDAEKLSGRLNAKL